MRVFIDTNVLASGFATRGLCADIIREVIAAHELIVSEYVLDELAKTLQVKFHVPREKINSVILLLRRFPVVPAIKNPTGIYVRDKKDIPVLAAALSCLADVLITGDRDLLILGKHGNLPILNPRAFWELLRSPHKNR